MSTPSRNEQLQNFKEKLAEAKQKLAAGEPTPGKSFAGDAGFDPCADPGIRTWQERITDLENRISEIEEELKEK
jgi:hypothetical protein